MLEEITSGWPSHASSDLTINPEPSIAEIAERRSGNLCRCVAYPNIVDAIRDVASREQRGETG